jgi:hypothetical protein
MSRAMSHAVRGDAHPPFREEAHRQFRGVQKAVGAQKAGGRMSS